MSSKEQSEIIRWIDERMIWVRTEMARLPKGQYSRDELQGMLMAYDAVISKIASQFVTTV